MRISVNIGIGMMFAMDGNPLFGLDASGQPDDGSKDECSRKANAECSMTQSAM
jgi:hypothetical protein